MSKELADNFQGDGGFINMRELSPETYHALETLTERRQWSELRALMEPEEVAWLVFRLEAIEDDEEVFPRGKWATLQYLQSMVRNEAIRQERLHG